MMLSYPLHLIFFVVLECGAAVGDVENWGTDGTVAYCSRYLPMFKFF